MSMEAFQQEHNVSRETLERLRHYEQLIKKWNPAINLVSKASLSQLWTRHFQDSAQLARFLPDVPAHWADLGSGGGLPGLILAIMAKEQNPDISFTLVESDIRKSVFLSTVVRELSLKVTVLSERIEDIDPLNADFLSARALAPLETLLGFSERHLGPTGIGVFPKGETWETEVKQAGVKWVFGVEDFTSSTNRNGKILIIGGISRV
jgi:16S rRNA (guanine527-N7)-methyltransferase